MMPFTYSIAEGITFGFISYAIIKLFSGQARSVSWSVWAIAIVFGLKLAFIG